MKRSIVILALCLSMIGGLEARSQAVPASQQTDQAELYAEIAGEYEFKSQDIAEILIVKFFVLIGELWGAPPGEEPASLSPVKDQPLKFEVDTGDEYFWLEFVRNEKGEIDTCILKTEKIEAIGKKIKKDWARS
jgi:hypothetical protein